MRNVEDLPNTPLSLVVHYSHCSTIDSVWSTEPSVLGREGRTSTTYLGRQPAFASARLELVLCLSIVLFSSDLIPGRLMATSDEIFGSGSKSEH